MENEGHPICRKTFITMGKDQNLEEISSSYVSAVEPGDTALNVPSIINGRLDNKSLTSRSLPGLGDDVRHSHFGVSNF